jgi:hypothetical protein
MKKAIFVLAIAFSGLSAASAQMPAVDRSRERNLATWKPAIAAYSQRHYGNHEWRLHPTCIVLHYTAGRTFPENLASSSSFLNETPGLASHYVVDGEHVWELLPPTVRCRGTYGINHHAVSIEMLAAEANDLMSRKKTMDTAARLVVGLLDEFHLTPNDVYSHEQVATMDTSVVPGVYDRINPGRYDKIDPGKGAMTYILARVRKQMASR